MKEQRSLSKKKKLILFFLVFLAAVGLIGWFFYHSLVPEKSSSASVLIPGESEKSGIYYVSQGNGLTISEVMHHNSAFLPDDTGTFPDWIELYNASSSGINLSRCILSDRQNGSWSFPDITLGAGEYLVVFADGKDSVSGSDLHTDFSLSDNETVFLLSAFGELLDSFSCLPCENDCSVIRDKEQDSFQVTEYPTPGFANSNAGFLHYQMSLSVPSGLFISEVKVDGSDYWETCDFIEFSNASDSPVELSRYYLSDDPDDLQRWQLPSQMLDPGEYICFLCADDGDPSSVPFSLGSSYEHLFLSDGQGLVDCLSVKNVPAGATYGRTESIPGQFYYSSATPGLPNGNGYRRVSESPAADASAGVYEDVGEVSVILSAPGTIYYTLDCSEPTTESSVYSGPISISSTTVLKVISCEYGMMPSETCVFTYVLNENHSLPVLSLVGKNPAQLEDLKDDYKKKPEIEGSLSFYEPSGSFTIPCGITLAGNTSLRLPYKSFKVHFRSCYGEKDLSYDLFGNGITEFSSLTLRKGQDTTDLVFTSEMWEDLARSMSDNLIIQGSRFCVLYVNGEYYGLCSLREDFSKQFYASRAGVPKSTVERVGFPFDKKGDFYTEVVEYAKTHRKLDDASYEYLCGKLDMDSFIDWMIMEGICGNFDLCRNVAFFRSSAEDGKWHTAFFDLDAAFKTPFQGVLGMTTFLSEETTFIVKSLLTNDQFLNRFLERYSEVYDKELSTEAILSTMEKYRGLLAEEVRRDLSSWGLNSREWTWKVDKEEQTVSSSDWAKRAIRAFIIYTHTSDEYMDRYFPGVRNWVVRPDSPDALSTEIPDTPDTPDNPDSPDTPDNPDPPDTPDNPDPPGTPDSPDTPDNPDIPVTPPPDTPGPTEEP